MSEKMSEFIELVDELIRTAHQLGEVEAGCFYNHMIKQDKEYLQKLRCETLDFWRDSPKSNNQGLLDRSLDIVDELECGDASEAMAEELRDTLTMLLGNQTRSPNETIRTENV